MVAAKHVEAQRGWCRRHYLTVVSLFAASACGMFGCGPGTMSLALFGMGKDKSLGFSAAVMSSLLALGSAGFSFGKLFGGPLSDRLGGKTSLCLILSVMGASQVLMSQRSSYHVLAVAWFITRTFHAAMWCGVMLVARPWFMTNNLSAALSLLTASCPTGAFSGALFGGRLLGTRGWRGVAWYTGILTLATGACVQLGVSRSPAAEVVPSRNLVRPRVTGNCKGSGTHRTLRDTAAVVLRNPKLWAVYSCSALITPTLDLPTLLPLYLDTLGLDPLRIGEQDTTTTHALMRS
jgi:sugar phosphate permease